MTDPANALQRRKRDRFYYGWINVMVAALAMVATLPGRTQGLGLVTEPLLRDLHLDLVRFGVINLWATLVGSAFCLVCGPLIDRFGTRVVLTTVLAGLGAVVFAMSRITNVTGLVITMTLTRGFGQSALSVVSMAIVGKWFVRRLPLAMGIYSLLLGIGFCIAFPGVAYAVIKSDWRTVWTWMGIVLLAIVTPIGWFLVRKTPEAMGLTVDGDSTPLASQNVEADQVSFTLKGALATPAFWVLALSGAMYGLLSSGILLFNESILRELGFMNNAVPLVLAIITLTGLIANFGGGWLAQHWPMGRLMGLAMFLLAIALAALPLVHTRAHVMAYAMAFGVSGGIIVVVFFACWGHAFGRAHLGQIQGAAQLMTVLASAIGPLLLANCRASYGAYRPFFYAMAPIVGLLAVCCCLITVPNVAEANVIDPAPAS